MVKYTYAFGDVHGMRESLEGLVAKCIEHAGTLERPIKFVFVGDYIDRGPDSKGVVDFLIELAETYECVFLRGNHEDMLLHDYSNFLYNGGFPTLKSYGWKDDGENAWRAVERMKDHMPFFKATELYHHDGLRTFVHAGIDRDKSLDQQSESYILWVRNPFLYDPRADGGYVVHGHTPQENGILPMEKDNRINLDTGAVFGGRMTCAVFDDVSVKPIEILQSESVRRGPLE